MHVDPKLRERRVTREGMPSPGHADAEGWIASAHYACPRCAGQAMRVRRHLRDRVLGLLLLMTLRRYACHDRECGWSGMLTRQPSRTRELFVGSYDGRSHRLG